MIEKMKVLLRGLRSGEVPVEIKDQHGNVIGWESKQVTEELDPVVHVTEAKPAAHPEKIEHHTYEAPEPERVKPADQTHPFQIHGQDPATIYPVERTIGTDGVCGHGVIRKDN